jgi:dihydroorotate dehydrogenase (NAD+) catalytic subunit
VTPDKVDLSCEVGDLRMPNPVMTASGCAGGRELAPFLEVADLGAFVTGSVTLDPCAGAGGRRLVETPSGVLHRTGLQNPGLQGFLTGELPWLAQRGARTVASIAAGTLGEYAELARRVGNSPGVRAVEVNLDLPGREAPARRLGEDPYQAGKVVAVVRREVPRGIPVLAKLVWQPGLVDLAGAVAREGAEAVVVSGQVPGAAIDRATLAPSVASGTVSGPAVHAVAVHAVWQVTRHCRTCRSSGSVAYAPAGTLASWCWPVHVRCRSAPPPCTTPAPRPGWSRSCAPSSARSVSTVSLVPSVRRTDKE